MKQSLRSPCILHGDYLISPNVSSDGEVQDYSLYKRILPSVYLEELTRTGMNSLKSVEEKSFLLNNGKTLNGDFIFEGHFPTLDLAETAIKIYQNKELSDD